MANNLSNKLRSHPYIVGAIALIVVFIALSYAGSLLLMKFNGLPLEYAKPFTAFEYYPLYKNSAVKSVRLSVTFCAAFPFLVMIGSAIYFYINRNKPRALHGDARFATYSEIKKAKLVDLDDYDKTILVGKYQNEYLSYGGFQFVMVAAPTRSGKGVGIVIPNCLNYSDSLVVLDIKLENFDITAGFRAEHGQEVYLFAPFDVFEAAKEPGKSAPMRTHRYNPLGYISDDPSDRMGDIDSIANALYNNPNSKDKFFDEQAKDLFRGICLLVLETPGLPKTFGEIFRQSSGYGKALPDHLNEMIEIAKSEGRPYSAACVDAIQRVCTLSDNTFAGVKGSMQVPLMPWANPRVDAATSANDFDLRDVRRKKMTIYLGITPNKLAEAKNIINIFFDQLINLNTRVLPQQDKSLKYQCLLILDEFTAIGKVNQIAQSISYQAGYNMRVLTIIQNKSQLEDVYGKPGALTLMSNHALMVIYTPSPVVQQDANEYSEMLGYETVKSTSKSRSYGKQGSTSDSTSDQKRALMLPQELKEMDMWEEIVSLEHTKPIKCGKIKYFEDPTFTSRINHPLPEGCEIPLIDLDEFLSNNNKASSAGEEKTHNLNEVDFDDPALLQKVVGMEELPDQDEIIKKLDSVPGSQMAALLGSEILSKLKTEKLSEDELASRFGASSEGTKANVESLFDGIDDSDDEIIFTEESVAQEAGNETENVSSNASVQTDDVLASIMNYSISTDTDSSSANSANEEATTTSASADSRSETDSGLDNTNSNSDISNTDETDMASIQNSVMNLFGFESSLADEDSISDEDSGALARLEAQLGLAS